MMVGLLLRDTVIPVLVAEVPTPRLSALGCELEAGVATAMLIPEVVCPAVTFTAVGLVAPLAGGLLGAVGMAGRVPPPQLAPRITESTTREIEPHLRISMLTLVFDAELRVPVCRWERGNGSYRELRN